MNWHSARSVLCVRLDNMGDVLMSTPAMQALADALPGRRLTLLTSHSAAALGPHLPMVSRVLAWDAPWARHAEDRAASAPGPAIAACARWLARLRFDAAVIFTVYSQSPLPAAVLCALAGIPLRLACCRENPYTLLSDWVPDTEPGTQPGQRPRHEAQRQLDLVAQVGALPRDTRLRFCVLASDRTAVAGRLAAIRAGRSGPVVVVHPGASAPSRRWPPARFAQVAHALAVKVGAHVLVTGDAAEHDIVRAVCAAAGHARVVPLAGALRLGEMGALLEAADLLVSNNTGPVHLAAALGTPVVDLYALTNPQHTPWQVPHRTLFADVPCRYCYKSTCPQGHHRCLEDVPATHAVQAALALLGGNADSMHAVELPWPGATTAAAAPAGSDALAPMPDDRATCHMPHDEAEHVHPWH
ncbi:glycosyltransferase family 9 protein [Cupriavidus taiwanensis]|uniref:Putative Lipopolysaccharide heptosyltransferase, Glycosyl transferase, family 9 n=1 Tax=Cupriavidus taiwanensis TaxID=164546 RepID=A0A375J4L4_9BURK|nr:glycosyltransferase family 9 protein [Cupriavidus taiwanensis]SPR99100.1 putative Lipopolysaccharide heptosyltransferase, Glycosyl transferase, family 9 [Cupriavidus taiwanensis]